VVVVVTAELELRGRPTGGAADGVVKRKGPLGKAAAVAENARRRRDWAVVVLLWPDEEDARLRTVLGVVLLRGRGWEMVVVVVEPELESEEWDIDIHLGRVRLLLGFDMVRNSGEMRADGREREVWYRDCVWEISLTWWCLELLLRGRVHIRLKGEKAAQAACLSVRLKLEKKNLTGASGIGAFVKSKSEISALSRDPLIAPSLLSSTPPWFSPAYFVATSPFFFDLVQDNPWAHSQDRIRDFEDFDFRLVRIL
jgi:hypothetical protein